MKDELLFCPLGGSGEIGMNMNLFGYGQPGDHKWIMVDIGVTFADDTIPGSLWNFGVAKMLPAAQVISRLFLHLALANVHHAMLSFVPRIEIDFGADFDAGCGTDFGDTLASRLFFRDGSFWGAKPPSAKNDRDEFGAEFGDDSVAIPSVAIPSARRNLNTFEYVRIWPRCT